MTIPENVEKFRLVFKGEIATGFNPEIARNNLCGLLNSDPSSIDNLFNGKPTCFKTDLNKEDAAKYKAYFDKTGCIAHVEPMLGVSPHKLKTSSPSTVVNTDFETMSCPKCAASQGISARCIKCGVIFEKIKTDAPSKRQESLGYQSYEISGWKQTILHKKWLISAICLVLFCVIGFTALNANSEKPKSEKLKTSSISYTPVPGDGPSDKEPFLEYVKKMFEDGRFDELDAMADDIRATKGRFQDGGWKMVSFYYGLNLTGNYPQWVFTNYIALAEKWRRTRPKSVTAQVVLAQAWYNYAWRERGHGYANEVKNDAWPVVNERLEKAWKIVNERPASGVVDCPERHNLRLTLANAIGIKREQYEALYQEAVRLEPTYYVFYFNKAEYLHPRWHGQEGEWQQFITEVAQNKSSVEGATIYTRTAWTKFGLWESFNGEGISWDVMRDGFAEMVHNYPNSTFILNAFARFACIAGDRKTLTPLLKDIDSNRYNPDDWGKISIDSCRGL